MSIRELAGEVISIFKRRNLIIILTLYLTFRDVSIQYYLFSLLAFLFLAPIVYSYILSYFFIETVDYEKIPEHRKVVFLCYFPFFKIILTYFAISLPIGFVMVNHAQSLLHDTIPSFVLIFFYFWMISCVFFNNKLWISFKNSFRAALSHSILYIVMFGILVLDRVADRSELFALTGQNVLAFSQIYKGLSDAELDRSKTKRRLALFQVALVIEAERHRRSQHL
ncbi:MAG: hypothetical protein HYY20_12060 [Candidatus Tectomicrobia bacterium]|uniref:Uncharacterized protein n=1 Tax=Tectimicrobiota bacterium TaxID=2528274 RepID=A0A932FWA5_UNCTE|nr:hypothetical protein [Candidatus Tectomicrobia bacterium]